MFGDSFGTKAELSVLQSYPRSPIQIQDNLTNFPHGLLRRGLHLLMNLPICEKLAGVCRAGLSNLKLTCVRQFCAAPEGIHFPKSCS